MIRGIWIFNEKDHLYVHPDHRLCFSLTTAPTLGRHPLSGGQRTRGVGPNIPAGAEGAPPRPAPERRGAAAAKSADGEEVAHGLDAAFSLRVPDDPDAAAQLLGAAVAGVGPPLTAEAAAPGVEARSAPAPDVQDVHLNGRGVQVAGRALAKGRPAHWRMTIR